jgi:tripartite-type tricarboxylate transporter receptor subunit TctC
MPAAADVYPHRTVKIIVAGVAGNPFDLVARALADKLSVSLKQTFLVETRPGAAGNLGAEFVAKAAPDGYTLLIALGTTFTVNPSLYKKLPYDPERDLRPVTIAAKASTMLVVHPSVSANSVAEFVRLAKQEPISYAHGGHGTPGHLSMEYFRLLAGFETIPVPYRGNAPLVTDLVAGQIKFGFVGTAGVVQHVIAGRLRALAISTDKRSPLAPEVPTLAEAGYPEFKVETYYVISAPAGTPEPILLLLEREIRQALASSDLQDTFRPQDIEILATTSAEARARLKSDAELWAKVVSAAHMQLD